MRDAKPVTLCRWCKMAIPPRATSCSYIYVAVFDSTQPFHEECLSEIWRLANAGRRADQLQPTEPDPTTTPTPSPLLKLVSSR